MKIDPDLCVGCGNCVAVCLMDAISLDPGSGRARVDRGACVECYACYREKSTEDLNPRLIRGFRQLLELFSLRFEPEPDVCPTSAVVPDELEWPRTVRRAFSDVRASHEETGVQARGPGRLAGDAGDKETHRRERDQETSGDSERHAGSWEGR